MELVRHRPPAPLDSHVACLWWSRRAQPQAHWEYMLPSGTVQLVFALHETPLLCVPRLADGAPLAWRAGIVHGPQSGYYLAGPKPAGVAVGVSLRPGGAGAVLGVAAAELIDRHVPLAALWGRGAGDLHERLCAAGQPPAVFRVLEDALLRRVQRPLLLHPAVAHVLACGDAAAPVAQLQRESGYSPRHFIGVFREAVGLAPKHFLRIQRLGRVARQLAAEPHARLAELAADAGYADQPHMTREFRALAGIAPGGFAPAARDRPLHHRAADPAGTGAG